MRTDLPRRPRLVAGLGLLACGSLAGLGWALVQAPGALAGTLLGGAATEALRRTVDRRRRRRLAALARPLPDEWRRFLLANCDHYDRLGPDLRARFEDDVRIFLAEKRITGVEVEADDELRLLVAASAVTLSVGWPEFEWDWLTEVLLYPEDFARDYSFERAELAGQAHPWGTVILSVPALWQSALDPDDGFHVGLHEFAHLLDLEDDGRMEGIPAGLTASQQREWSELASQEMARLRRGKSVVDDYGGDEPAEFFAVAVEAFFERSLALRARHRELYAFLAQYFKQDPAAWDEARGLMP